MTKTKTTKYQMQSFTGLRQAITPSEGKVKEMKRAQSTLGRQESSNTKTIPMGCAWANAEKGRAGGPAQLAAGWRRRTPQRAASAGADTRVGC
jgi:hypothetical protein